MFEVLLILMRHISPQTGPYLVYLIYEILCWKHRKKSWFYYSYISSTERKSIHKKCSLFWGFEVLLLPKDSYCSLVYITVPHLVRGKNCLKAKSCLYFTCSSLIFLYICVLVFICFCLVIVETFKWFTILRQII